MSITLGAITFDEVHTTVREQYEEVGGRDGRKIEITGVIFGQSPVSVEDRLDTILEAASGEDYEAELSLRPGRRLWVRREKFAREVNASRCVGAFTLVLEARVPYEEAVEARVVEWPINTQEAQLALAAEGNAPVAALIALHATGQLVSPSFSDGSRAIAYAGTIAAGSCLTFDGVNSRAMLDGQDVTAYTSGVFPHVAPGGTLLQWSDAEASSHNALATVELRDRWW